MPLYVLSLPQTSINYQQSVISKYNITNSNIINTWIPIKLNRYDFNQLFLKTQKTARYIRNTIQGNSVDLNGYWAIFKIYDNLQKEIKVDPIQFSLSDNAIPINNTDLSFINGNNIKQLKKIQTIYDSQLIVSPTDENPISLTLDLKKKYDISKILISHIPDNRIFYNNIIEISEDGINWEVISNQEYNEQYGGKYFYFFDENNIVFINNNENIVEIDNQPILKSICYAFDIDNNYQFYMIKNETISNKTSNTNKIYMYYQKEKQNYDNIILSPQQELIVDFTNTNYDNEVNIIKQRYIKFILPPDGININEIEIRDIFGINILQDKSIFKYSDNLDVTNIHTFKFIVDGVINTTTDYAKVGNSLDGDYQYIIYDLGKEYPITSIKIYPLYQNDNELTNNIIYNFKCEYSIDNINYKELYDTNKNGLIFSSPIGKELLNLKIEYDNPMIPIQMQYIRYKYIQSPTLYKYIPFLPKLKDELFIFTYNNRDYANIRYTDNIVFKELLANYVTVDYTDVIYNYNNDYSYYLSIIDTSYIPYIEYQLPTILNIYGLTIINNYINNLENISFSIDGVNYTDIYNSYFNKISPNSLYKVKNYGIKNNGIYISELLNSSIFDNKTVISFNDISIFDNNNKILMINFINLPQSSYDNTFYYDVITNSNFKIIVKYINNELEYGININSTFYKIGVLSTTIQEEIFIGIRNIYNNDQLELQVYSTKDKIIPFNYTIIDNISITNSSQSLYLTNSSYTIIGNSNIESSFSLFKLNYIYLISLSNINDIESVPQSLLNII